VLALDCRNAVVSGNTATDFTHPVRVEGGAVVSVADDAVAGGLAAGVSAIGASGASVVGNTFDAPQPAPGGANVRLLVRSNNGLDDSA
jgi:hypothetical protein